MTETEWTKVEGMVIAPNLEPKSLAEALQARSVVAQIEWYAQTPELVGIRVATDDQGNVATLSKRATNPRPGMPLGQLVAELAETFGAEVMIGDVSEDAIQGEGSDPVGELRSQQEELPVRIVEIGRTPASAVPLMAAFEGTDIAELELPADKRLLAAVLPPHRAGWYFGDAPLVTMTMSGDEFQAFFIAEDDPESVVTYNWGMTELMVSGAQGVDVSASPLIQEMVGSRADIQAIHDAVPGIDLDAAFAAAQLRGPAAVEGFVAALGLPSDLAAFLLGNNSLEQIRGAAVHRARGISNAIGRSVDMLIDERSDGSKFWDAYTGAVTSKPWLVPAATAVEAAGGVALVVLGRKRDGRRSAAGRLGTVLGSLMIVDAVAQNLLAKYTARRVHRREQRENLMRP